ncbi:MAG: peptidylprolyl isomerase [Bacteroidales bacterium]|nr:peptidylprolyl isomerase [Bacteroidales bacterium]
MKVLILYALAMSMLLCSCGGCKDEDKTAARVENVYNDATLRKICELKCEGNTAEILQYISSEYPQYRKAAVEAIGSMRDKMAILPLVGLLNHEDVDLRESAVFAIGQTMDPFAEKQLLDIDINSQPDNVKAAILVALGKCGSQDALKMVQDFDAPHTNVTLVSGKARSLCWFAKRGMHSVETSQTSIAIMCDTLIHEKARAIAAEYFGVCDKDFSLYTDEFVAAYRSAKLVYNKVNIVLALGKCHNARAFSLIKSIVTDENSDYRVVMNAIAAFENYPYDECKPYILDLLKSEEEKIASRAALYIYNKGISQDANEYLELSRSVAGWQTRTTLTSAALRYSVNKDNISQRIKSGLEASQNIYEKAALISALKSDISNFRFVDRFTNSNGDNDDILREESIKTLVSMYESDEFEEFARNWRISKGEDLYAEFGMIFRKAVQNGNMRMVAIAADAIARAPEIATKYMNPYFLKQAVFKCELPRDADTYMSLKNAVKQVLGEDVGESDAGGVEAKPDWNYICSVKPGEEIVVSTKKGDITIKTDINNAPIAVSNFLKLVDEKYFDKTQFNNITLLRVENRGSLSTFDVNKTVMIPSELTPMEFEEGTVALTTSALNSSYTTQWFVMLTPDALSDGGSSVIGVVTDGIEVVHSINTGDEIITISRKK